jgi:crossover junction endodeoxyribonuclease RuvC
MAITLLSHVGHFKHNLPQMRGTTDLFGCEASRKTWNRMAGSLFPVNSAFMRVLAIDASLRHSGVAVVDGANGQTRALFHGTIHNAASLKPSACLVAIRGRLADLIREYEPECCALESVIYVQSYKTAITLGAARGAAILAAAENGLPVFEYAPRRIKQATVGTGAAAKNQVAFMMRAMLALTETPDADAADALAVALTHLRAHEMAKLGIPAAGEI